MSPERNVSLSGRNMKTGRIFAFACFAGLLLAATAAPAQEQTMGMAMIATPKGFVMPCPIFSIRADARAASERSRPAARRERASSPEEDVTQ